MTTLLTADQIQRRIIELAAQINADYSDGEPLHFVAVLKGAFVFLSDLARAMSPRPVTLDFGDLASNFLCALGDVLHLVGGDVGRFTKPVFAGIPEYPLRVICVSCND